MNVFYEEERLTHQQGLVALCGAVAVQEDAGKKNSRHVRIALDQGPIFPRRRVRYGSEPDAQGASLTAVIALHLRDQWSPDRTPIAARTFTVNIPDVHGHDYSEGELPWQD